MKSRMRNRAAALGIATVTGLAGIGFVGGPAMAADTSSAKSSSETSDSGVGTQSVYYPTVPVTYADELVRAWGQGATDRVEAFASPKVAKALANHEMTMEPTGTASVQKELQARSTSITRTP
ncbi:hypothetical protein [Brevibacterium sp. FAM 24630]|uniref:hypothetical protein n=1 Tax=Brevibacterium sp. FAM 24630 TaxID=3415680 RepID=UPI003C7EBB2E